MNKLKALSIDNNHVRAVRMIQKWRLQGYILAEILDGRLVPVHEHMTADTICKTRKKLIGLTKPETIGLLEESMKMGEMYE